MNQRGQVSFEYLLTVAFVVMLIAAVIIVSMQVVNIALVAQTQILANRSATIEAIMG